MTDPEVQNARDYNRGPPPPNSPAPIRLAPVKAWQWLAAPGRGSWSIPALWLIAAAIIGRWDGWIAHQLGEPALPAWMPAIAYGALLIVAAAAIGWHRLPEIRNRLADLAAAFLATFMICGAIPLLVGRPRPKFGDPGYFIGPFGEYPLGPGIGVRHSWEFWVPRVSDIWSLPSREAAYAALAAVMVGAVIARMRIVAWLAAIAGCAAVLGTGRHYPSDIIVGAVVGAAAARTALARSWGQRLLPGGRSPG